jgi:hypothetical protein
MKYDIVSVVDVLRIMEHCWNDTDRGIAKILEEEPVPILTCLRRIWDCPGIKPGSPWSKAGNQPAESFSYSYFSKR